MINLSDRFRQPKPPLFRRIGYLCFAVGFASSAVLVMPIALPAILYQTAVAVLAASLSGLFVCGLTVSTDDEFVRWLSSKKAFRLATL